MDCIQVVVWSCNNGSESKLFTFPKLLLLSLDKTCISTIFPTPNLVKTELK